MLELRSAGSYFTCQDWSPSPSQLLCFSLWRIQHLSWIFTGIKKSDMSQIYTWGAIKCYSCRHSQRPRCFTASCLCGVWEATITDFMCNPWHSCCMAPIKPLFIRTEEINAIKRLRGINQFISWSNISWQVNSQPLNAWMGVERLPCCPSREPTGHRHSNTHRNPFGKTLANVNSFSVN